MTLLIPPKSTPRRTVARLGLTIDSHQLSKPANRPDKGAATRYKPEPVVRVRLNRPRLDKNASESTAAISEAKTAPMPISIHMALPGGRDDTSGCKTVFIVCHHPFLGEGVLSFCYHQAMGREYLPAGLAPVREARTGEVAGRGLT